jgi:hypothetical protein
MVDLMANRDTLYRKFGPLIIDAIMVLVFQEINSLRTKVGLTPYTSQQAIDALQSKLELLSKYDWME